MTSESQKLLSRKTNITDPPDGGWGWAVVFGSFLYHTIGGGMIASYGILYVAIMDIYNIDKVSVSWIGSLRTGFLLGTAPLIVPFTKFFSCRLLTVVGGIIAFTSLLLSAFLTSFLSLLVCLGIIQGVAFSFVDVSSLLIVNYYFDKKRPIAIGLALFGTGVGQTLFPPLQELLLREYGLSGVLLINSAVVMNLIVCGVLYFPLPIHNFQRKKADTQKKNRTIWKNIREAFDYSVLRIPIFVMYCINNVFIYMGLCVPFAFLPDRIVNEGFTLKYASFLVSIIGMANGFGRIVIGILTSKIYNFRPTFYVILNCISGTMICLLPLCRRYTDFVLFSVGFGFTTGGFVCLCNVLLLDLFTRELLASSLGFVTLAQGIGGFTGGPAAAGISEVAGSDDAMFYFGGAMIIISGVLLQVSLFCRSRDVSELNNKQIHVYS